MKNATFSPFATVLLIFGIMFLVIPPVGIALLVAGIVTQVRYARGRSGSARAQQRVAYEKAIAKHHAEKAAAFRSLS